MRKTVRQFVEGKIMHDYFQQDALATWTHYQSTGLHATSEEADAWLAKLESGEVAQIPECHI